MFPIHPIEISNPFFEGRNTVYVIESDPAVLIDTGVATQIAYDRFLDGLNQSNLELQQIGRIILTHKHIDHIGNAWRIQRATGAEILIHESECSSVASVDPKGDRFVELVDAKLQEWQVPTHENPAQQETDDVKGQDAKARPNWEIEPATPLGLHDGQLIPLGNGSDHELEVIHTPGHTMGSICLRYKQHLFTGDHVLPKMSPNIGGGDLRHPGLLRHFFDSLNRVNSLEGVNLAMPGHGQPFEELTARCRKLEAHHHRRLDHVVSVLDDGAKTVYEIARALFGELKDIHVMLGCAEANSHLEYLLEEGRVKQMETRFLLV